MDSLIGGTNCQCCNEHYEPTQEELDAFVAAIHAELERKRNMPHYKDGTEAKVGDIVIGHGYNVKDAVGNLKQLVGTVIGIIPNSGSCNIRVAHIKTTEIPNLSFEQAQFYQARGTATSLDGKTSIGAYVDMEYGQCDHFQLLQRDGKSAAIVELVA